MPQEGGLEPREPIRAPLAWAGLLLLVLVGVPWYLPAGTIGPVLLGFPLWTLIAVLSSLALCGYLSWMLLSRWETPEQHADSPQEPPQEPPRGTRRETNEDTSGHGGAV
ncbi:hypothetical protein [Actinopolyspora saharensis]|uniref:Uncharacterized protein n=1 Tax=Actinopolyspora saharensis TaxID=995062 RepID=A0A1H0ZBK4_9ACTN|nr:hypothetical protein [Actinopolyspora saharensis]SDQ24807.1 hypothetical protein SAMN04489718_0952 [Actinopolyspora saharensis]